MNWGTSSLKIFDCLHIVSIEETTQNEVIVIGTNETQIDVASCCVRDNDCDSFITEHSFDQCVGAHVVYVGWNHEVRLIVPERIHLSKRDALFPTNWTTFRGHGFQIFELMLVEENPS